MHAWIKFVVNSFPQTQIDEIIMILITLGNCSRNLTEANSVTGLYRPTYCTCRQLWHDSLSSVNVRQISEIYFVVCIGGGSVQLWKNLALAWYATSTRTFALVAILSLHGGFRRTLASVFSYKMMISFDFFLTLLPPVSRKMGTCSLNLQPMAPPFDSARGVRSRAFWSFPQSTCPLQTRFVIGGSDHCTVGQHWSPGRRLIRCFVRDAAAEEGCWSSDLFIVFTSHVTQ